MKLIATNEFHFLQRIIQSVNLLWQYMKLRNTASYQEEYSYKLNSVAWVRKRSIPTERPPLVGEVKSLNRKKLVEMWNEAVVYHRIYEHDKTNEYRPNLENISFGRNWHTATMLSADAQSRLPKSEKDPQYSMWYRNSTGAEISMQINSDKTENCGF
jgi:hypothetical protein